ncbi:MAG TPA: DDE-type integrase/transposase/recombinase [Candidatus Acidoferrum sp.]|nr:DDE-type integrase/transposase/recombinase [Candidatus Acidoferrum sp.]
MGPPTAPTDQEHGCGVGSHRQESRGHRRPHLGEATGAGGQGGRLQRLGPQPAPSGGEDEIGLATEAPPLSALGATPGQHLVIDWTKITAGLHMFCAVLAWSRYRFVRFANNETGETTLGLLAECFEELGAMTAVVLSDRMACLKNGIVANVVVPHPEYVRFAAHYGFRPDFCEGGDPESKGVVENLVGYAQRDLVVPAGNFGGNVAEGNRQAKLWGIEVNARLHSETQAVPAQRLEQERQLMRPLPSLRPALCRGELRKVNKTQTIRFGSARYSLPTEWVGKMVDVSVVDHEVVLAYDGRQIDCHPLMAPGEVSIKDEHYKGKPHQGLSALRHVQIIGTIRLPSGISRLLERDRLDGVEDLSDQLLAEVVPAIETHRTHAACLGMDSWQQLADNRLGHVWPSQARPAIKDDPTPSKRSR